MRTIEFELESLEPRLLLSADPVAELATSALAPDTPVIVETQADPEDELFGDLHELPESTAESANVANSASGIPPLAPVDPVAESATEPEVEALVETLVTTLNAANPPPAFGGPRSGSVTSEGVSAMGADTAKTLEDGSAIDGSGVIVAVISDSFDATGNAATDVTNMDLPAGDPTVRAPVDSTNLTDEGRAMLQLVHDVAPGATLLFSSFNVNDRGTVPDDIDSAYAAVISGLVGAGADIIIDDIFEWFVPWFQDGQTAQAVDAAVASGVAYFATADNFTNNAYEVPPDIELNSGFDLHNFDTSGGTDYFQEIYVDAGRTLEIVLQWSEPWATPTSDYNLTLLNTDSIAGTMMGTNPGTGVMTLDGQEDNLVAGDNNHPYEVLAWENNTGSGLSVFLAIERVSATAGDPATIKYIINDLEIVVLDSPPSGSTVVGHHNAIGAMTVGAADHSTPAATQSYSGVIGQQIAFNSLGNALSGDEQSADWELRKQHFVIGPDNVSIATTTNVASPFEGTSAAAPQVGAVAALMLETAPTLSPLQIYDILEATATDIGTVGFDNESGHGFVNAEEAVNVAANAIGGTVWIDQDGDGLRDDFGTNEPRESAVEVLLWEDDGSGDFDDTLDSLVATTITNAQGQYTFYSQGQDADGTNGALTALELGNYFVQVVLPSGTSFVAHAADGGLSDTEDSDISDTDGDTGWSQLVSVTGGGNTIVDAGIVNGFSMNDLVLGLTSGFDNLDGLGDNQAEDEPTSRTVSPILNLDELGELPLIDMALSEVLNFSDIGRELVAYLEDFAAVSATLSAFTSSNPLKFVVRVDGGEPTEVAVSAAALADNTSAADVVSDLNDAIADAGLDTQIQAEASADGFAISAIDDQASGTISISFMRLTTTGADIYGQTTSDLSFDVTVTTQLTVESDSGTTVETDTETYTVSLDVDDTEDNATLAELVADINAAFALATSINDEGETYTNPLSLIQAFESDDELVFAATDPDVTTVSFGDITDLGFSGSSLVLDPGAADLGLSGLRGVSGLKFASIDEFEGVLLEALQNLSGDAFPDDFDLDFNYDGVANEITFNLGVVKSFSQSTDLDFSDGFSLGGLGTIEFVAAATAGYSVDLALNMAVGIDLGSQSTGFSLLADLNDGAGVPILVGITAASAAPSALEDDLRFDVTIAGGDHEGVHTVEYVHASNEIYYFDSYDVAAAMNAAMAGTDLEDAIEFFFDGTHLNVWAIDSTIYQLDIGASDLEFTDQTSHWPDLAIEIAGVVTELPLDGLNTIADVQALIETTGLLVTLDEDTTSIIINGGTDDFSIGGAEMHGNTSLAALSLGILGEAMENEDGDFVIEGPPIHGNSVGDRFFIVEGADPNLELAITGLAEDIELSAALGSFAISATEAEGQPFQATLSLPIRLTDPGTEAADGRISMDELTGASFADLVEVTPTADVSGCLELSADVFADVLSGPLATLCFGLETPNEFSTFRVTTDTAGFEDAVSELKNLSFEQIVAIVRSLIEELKDSDSALMNTTLPVLDRSPSEIIDFVDRILDAIDAFVFSLDLDAIEIARGSLDAAIGNLPVDIDLKADLYTAIDAFDAVLANRDWNADGLIDDDDDNDGRRGPRFIAAIGDMLREIELYLGAEIGTIVEGDTYNYEMVQAYLSLFDLIPTFDTFADRLEAAVEAQLGDFPGITFDVELDVADFATDEKAIVVGIEISQDDAIDTSFEPEMPTGDLGPIALDTDANFALHGGGAVSLALAFKLDELTGDSSSETGVYLIVADNVGGYTPTGVEFNLGFDGDFTGDVSIGALDLVTAEADISLLSTTATNNPGVDDSETTENRASITIDFDDGSHSISNDIGAVPFSGVFSALDVTTDGVIEGSMDVSILGPAVEFITLEVDIADPLNPTINVNEDVLADLLENIEFDLRTIVAGISALLDLLEAGLTSDIISSLPLIGNGLDLAGGFLGDLNAKLVDPFEAFLAEVDGSFEDLEIITSLYLWHTLGQPDAATVTAEAMDYLTLPGVPDWIGYTIDFDGLGLIADFTDIHVDADSDYFEIAIDITGSDTLAEVSLDSGLGGLPISADVGVTVGMDYGMTFGVGVSKAQGFYLLDPNFAAAITAELTGSEANPASFDFDLFGLRLSAADSWQDLDGDAMTTEHTSVTALVELGMALAENEGVGSAGGYLAHDLADTPFSDLFSMDAELSAYLSLRASAAINSALPSVSVGLNASINGGLSYIDGEIRTDFDTDFSFDGVQINLGDFLSDFIGPAIETVNEYLEPVQPILDVLTSEIPGVSEISKASGGGAITLIDLALVKDKEAAQSAKKFINVVAAIVDVIDALAESSEGGEVIIDLGALNVGSLDEGWNDTYSTDGIATARTFSPADSVDSQVAGGGNSALASVFSAIGRAPDSQGGGGLGIGLDFLDPSNIFAYLMGQTADVITWDIPRFDLGFEWGIKLRPVPIVPPLVVTIGMNAGFFVDLSVGYDTRGVQTGNFLDGFFFGDLEDVTHGEDIDEFGLGVGLSLGAGLDIGVASAGIEGEIRLDGFANWRDTDDDGKLYLDEIASIISQDGVDCLFDWRAEISAIIRIVWEILGVDGSRDIIDVVIAEFDSEGHCPKAHIAHVAGDDDSDFSDELPHDEGTAADGTLIIHTGHFADKRGPGSTSDTSESIDVTYLAPGVYRVAGMGLEQQFGGVSSIFFDGGDGTDELHFLDTGGSPMTPTIPITAYGGDGQDLLPGSSVGDFLYGGGGDDTITGEAGVDWIEGGSGADTIDGGGGGDDIWGNDGVDTITGGEGDDEIFGGDDDDLITGDDGADEIDGGSGVDTIDGGSEGDIINGGSGADIITGGTGDDTIDGDAGDDYIEGQDGGDYIDGGSGNDVIYGDDNPDDDIADGTSPGADEIYGDEGHDAIYAGAGSDFIYAGAGNDLVVGSTGGDTILGGWGNDILIAHEIGDVSGTESHHIEGGPDDDFICGTDGEDRIYGGTSETTLTPPISSVDITPLQLLEILDGEVALTDGGYDVVSCVEEHTPTLTLPTFITISGTKFEDLDGDGVQNTDEPGLPGWTIEVYDGNGDLVTSTETADDGSYDFFLQPDSYTLREVEQATHTNITGEHSVTTVASGKNFANQPLATIEGRKWHDIDEDGYYDRAVEPGIAGILIFVDYDGDGRFDEDTEPFAETASDNLSTAEYEAGTYSITGVEPGDWNIIEVLDYTSATKTDGVFYMGTTAVLAEIAGTDWAPTAPEDGLHAVSVTAGEVLDDINFGNVKAAEVTGGKFADENGDGVRQPHETGVFGIQIYDDENDNGALDEGEPWVYTLPDGSYRLGSLAPGTHNISEVSTTDFEPLEVRGALTHELELEAAESATANFANNPDGGITDGQKYEDSNGNGHQDAGEPGISGITIYADFNLNDTRDAGEPWTMTRDYDFDRDGEIDPETEAGWYRLSKLPIGTIRIAEDTADYALVLPASETAVVEFGGVVTEAMLLGGFRGIWENTQVGDTWSIRYLTDYNAADQIASPHRSLFHAISAYALTIGGRTFGGAIPEGATQVRVFENHPNGIDQFEVSLPILAGPFVAILQLDDTSDTAFTDDKQPHCGALHLNDFDFRHFALRDVISDGAINANITWHRCTDDSGIYVDITNDDDHVPGTDLPNQNVETVEPLNPDSISAGYAGSFTHLSLAARSVAVIDGSDGAGSISGTKWSDLDRDGEWDSDEPGLEGITIYLDQNNNGVLDEGEVSTVTDEDGHYNFLELADGVYVVREVAPENGEQTYPRSRLFASLWEAGIYEYGFETGGYWTGVDALSTTIGVASSPVDGFVYALTVAGDLYAYDPDDYTRHSVGSLGSTAAEGDIAFDPSNGVLHLIRGTTGVLRQIQIAYDGSGMPTLAGTTAIGSTGLSDPSALAFNALGELYILDTDGVLHSVDKTTATVTESDSILSLGDDTNYLGMAFDPLDDDLLYIAAENILVTYNLETSANLGFDIFGGSDDFSGLAFLEDTAHIVQISSNQVKAGGRDFGNYLKIVVPDGDDLIYAQAGGDTVYGDNVVDPVLYISEPGADEIYGQSGKDFIYGQEEGDILSGGLDTAAASGTFDDYIDGGLGDDTVFLEKDIDMTLTNTSLIGDGTDTLVSIERAHLIGGSSGNTLDASAFAMGAVHLEGHDGDDVLLGGSFGDTLEPGDGVAFDTAEGNDGDDTYVFIDGTGDITINELAGTDTLDFSHLLSPLTLDLSGVVITGGFSRAISGSAAGFEIIIGTDFDDTLTGNAATDNTFYPGLGGDTLDGQGGANTYIFAATSGFETEKVIGAPSPGTDLLDFSAINLNTNVDFNGGVVTHTDRRVTVSDVDYAHTGSGDDIFTNNTHANSFVSSTGDDTFIIYDHGSSVKITDDGGIETLDFRNTDGVTLDLISGAATIASLTHGQTVDGLNTDFEIIYGSPFADTIDGNDLANTIYPGDGLDTINGQGGDDIYIITSLEAVTIDDASGADTLDFSAVTGPLTFNLAGSILADNGFNSIATSATDAFESIIATAQDDHYIFADTGTHSITDSGGTDTFDFSALTSAITADLRGTSTAITLTVSIDPGTEIENLIGSDHADSLTGNDLANHLQGGLGDDSLFGLKGADTLLAESDAATNTLDGGSGDDLYPFESGTIITTTTTILIEDSGRVAGGLAAGGGTDTLDLSALGSVSIDLSSILLQSITHHHDINLQDSAGVSSDYFENLIGSVSAPNAITGNAADNHFTGGDADDTYIILPGFGADTISESIISAFDSIDMSAMSAIGDPIDLLIGSGNLLFTVGTDTLSAPDRIENILLGAGDDYFHFTALGSTSAAIDGNGGVNTYDGDPADTGGVTNF